MHNLLHKIRLGEDRLRQVLHLHESQTRRERAAQRFWSRPPQEKTSFWWHMRGGSAYSDEQWLGIGRRHVELFRRLSGVTTPPRRVVEWGCGGGANAIAFAQGADDFYGVDISRPSLEECARQVATVPNVRFHPVAVDVPRPEAALDQLPRDVDLFICVYVIEVFPSQAYGRRIVQIGYDLLKPGGHALLQIKYSTDEWKTRPREWGYTRGVASMTTYRIDQFWTLCESVGFEPVACYLVPKPAEVPDERYAYYVVRKPLDGANGDRVGR